MCTFVVALLGSCSFATEYTLLLQAHTYIPEEMRSSSFDVPGSELITLYVLPAVELESLVDTLSEQAKGGLLVDVPQEIPEEIPTGDAQLEVGFDVEVTLRNDAPAGSFPEQRLTVFMAPASASNVYTEGQAVGEVQGSEVLPGEQGRLSLSASVATGDQAFRYLEEGAFRVGVSLALTEPRSVSLTGRYSIDRVDLALRGYPQRLAAYQFLD